MSGTKAVLAPQPTSVAVAITTDPRLVPSPYPEIAKRAYELYEQRGCRPGHEREDWIRAESELLRTVPVEISHTSAHTKLRANLLGFWPEELTACVEPYRVTIYGKKRLDPQSGNKITYVELSPDTVFCRLDLYLPVKPENAIAVLCGGWLEVTIPLAEVGLSHRRDRRVLAARR